MASVVQICNMALSHIGSHATVTAISPADGSVEADLCARFYDQARTELLEPGTWPFALKRADLTAATNDSDGWAYKYAKPSDCLRPLRMLTPAAAGDKRGEDFVVEGDYIYTNLEDATLLYSYDVGDTTKYSPTFVSALTYMLAAYLAGPIIKGNEGTKVSDSMRQIAMQRAEQAAASLANGATESNDYEPEIVAVRS